MEVSNELLAAYAEGNVSDAERDLVRKYLTDNPDELETVMMMMDQDFDLDLEDEPLTEQCEADVGENAMADVCYSAAAFAPRIKPKSIKSQGKPKPLKMNSQFMSRLNNLLDEIKM